MDLWIRSQDRKRLTSNPKMYIDEFGGIFEFTANEKEIFLGKYDSEERAIEVLDEIQNILKSKYMIRMDNNLNNITKFLNINGTYVQNQNNADIKNINNTCVYEMPKE